MHRTLYITEIIRYIFSFLDLRSNARNARVCKTWKDAALDATWRVVGPDVFRSLAQMLRNRDGSSSPIDLVSSDDYIYFSLTQLDHYRRLPVFQPQTNGEHFV